MVRTFIALNDHTIRVHDEPTIIRKGDTFKGRHTSNHKFVVFTHFMCYNPGKDSSTFSSRSVIGRAQEGNFCQLSKKAARAQYRDNSKNRKWRNPRKFHLSWEGVKEARRLLKEMVRDHDAYIKSLDGECPYCQDPGPSRNCCYYNTDCESWVEQRLVSKADKTGKFTDVFTDVYVDISNVTECPECHRELTKPEGN